MIADLAVLTAAIDDTLQKRRQDNLLIATWNTRAFGSLTRKGHSGPDDNPKRDLHSALAIAEMLGRFDVIAVQEVKTDLRALRDVLKLLAPQWALCLDGCHLWQGRKRRTPAYLFDTERRDIGRRHARLAAQPDVFFQYSAGPRLVAARQGHDLSERDHRTDIPRARSVCGKM